MNSNHVVSIFDISLARFFHFRQLAYKGLILKLILKLVGRVVKSMHLAVPSFFISDRALFIGF